MGSREIKLRVVRMTGVLRRVKSVTESAARMVVIGAGIGARATQSAMDLEQANLSP